MRVNLLKKSEVRYQGAVSRKFLWTTMISAVLGMALLVGVIVSMTLQARRVAMRNLATRLDRLTPQVRQVEQMNEVLAHNRATREALDAWGDERLVWSRVALDLQYQVPDSVQMRGIELHIAERDGRHETRMTLDGLAIHPHPEDVAVRFQRSLLEIESLKLHFDSIRLVTFNRRARTVETPEQATFSIVGTGKLSGSDAAGRRP